MSEDIQLEQEVEEVDVLSLLATQSEEAEDEEVEDDGNEPDSLESALEQIQVLKERIGKRNKSVKKAKDAQHRTQSEYDALLKRLEALENAPPTATKDDGVAKLEQQAQDWRDRVEDDPTQVTGYMDWQMGNLEDRIARFLGDKLGAIETQMSGWQKQTNPELREYATQMEALRNAGVDLDDESLLKVAKTLGTKKVKTPPSTVGGLRKKATESNKSELSDEDRQKIRDAVRAGMST